MALKLTHDTEEEIPETYRDLYTEQGGKWVLTGVEGMKTQADIDRIQSALTKERNDHKVVKDALAKFNGLDPDEVHAALDRIPELEAASAGQVDEAKLEELADARARKLLGPVERERDKAIRERDEAVSERDESKGELKSRDIRAQVTAAALKGKVVDTALDDVLMLGDRVFEIGDDGAVTARDGMGVTPGITPEAWLTEMQDKRPHWWPPSEGGGAGGGSQGGGGGANPWKADQWNMTAQGQVYKESPERAERLAKQAGTTIGGPRPLK